MLSEFIQRNPLFSTNVYIKTQTRRNYDYEILVHLYENETGVHKDKTTKFVKFQQYELNVYEV